MLRVPFRSLRYTSSASPTALSLLGAVAAAAAVLVACSSDSTNVNPAQSDAGADAPASRIVCGQPGSLCAGNEWCQYDLVGSCGKDGQRGGCTARPQTCPTDCPAVCGCDGKVYCNACEAQAAGSDVATGRDCLPGTGEMLAYSLPGAPPRLVLFKKDAARGLCFRLTLIQRQGTRYGLDIPTEWGVDGAEATHDPADCSLTSTGTPPTPKGETVGPINGQGRVTFSADRGQTSNVPCSMSIAARLQFEPSATTPWVPNVEAFSAQGVTVTGACP